MIEMLKHQRHALRFHEANSTEQHVQMCFLLAVANLHHSNVCDEVRAVRNTKGKGKVVNRSRNSRIFGS